ncbi:MAG: 5'-methylthioadenosine/adenosylhomocysteine nucleosidase [Spirochaetota bacterium]
MTAVLGAMDGEVEAVVDALSGSTTHRFGAYTFHVGTLNTAPVVVGKSGVGKARAAMVTQYLIDHFPLDSLVFTGLAGSINPDIRIGDTLIARDCMQHDLDASALGFARGEIPYEQTRVFVCEPDLVSRARQVEPETGRVHVGRVLTGDQFIDRNGLQAMDFLRSELDGDAVEMEGASVASVCSFNGLPFCLVRTISDEANRNAKVDFERFLPVASANSMRFIRALTGAV